jgi:large subunit ribosomal protein L24
MKIKKGDTVKIISGKDRGKLSKVLSVLGDSDRVVVEKVNVAKIHKKQTGNQKDPGGIIEVERPISISKVMVVCPSCNKSTRVGWKISKDKKVRICKKCKNVLDK